MLDSLAKKIWNYEDIRETYCEGGEHKDDPTMPVYLRRFFVWNDNLGPEKKPHIYLHHILRSDPDRELHDHPWDFVSIILWRGYWEESPAGVMKRKWPGMILYRKGDFRHRLYVPKPAWTLVYTRKKHRDWGFWVKDNWVFWKDYIFGCKRA